MARISVEGKEANYSDKTWRLLTFLWPVVLTLVALAVGWGMLRERVDHVQAQVIELNDHGSVAVQQLSINLAAHTAMTKANFDAIKEQLARMEKQLDDLR